MARVMTLKEKRYIPTVPLPVTPPWLFLSVSIDLHIQEKNKSIKISQILQSWLKIDYRQYIKHFFKYILMDPRILAQGLLVLFLLYQP